MLHTQEGLMKTQKIEASKTAIVLIETQHDFLNQ